MSQEFHHRMAFEVSVSTHPKKPEMRLLLLKETLRR
jgi:hypothetical protein